LRTVCITVDKPTGIERLAHKSPPTDDPGPILAEAMDLHRAGRLAEADLAYARVLALVPEHARALRLRGILARERGDLERSVGWLRQATAAAPADAEAPAELGLSYLAAGYLNLADRAFRQALARNPAALKARANLGALSLYRGRLDESMACYRQVLAAEPADAENRCNLANALAEAGHSAEALALLAEGEALDPGLPLWPATRGAVLVGLARYAEAVEVLEQSLTRQPADDMALINLAYARQQLGQAEAALAVLYRAVAANPDNARATADLVSLLASRGGFEAALALSAGFLARHPGERLVLAAHTYALRDAGRVEEAATLLDLEQLVAVSDLPEPRGPGSLPELNAALRDGVLVEPTLKASPRSKSTRQGLQTGELDPDAMPALATWRDLVHRAVKAELDRWRRQGLAAHPALAPAPERWTLRIWATVLEAGGYQTAHLHPLGWLSGVYYVECPGDLAAEAATSGAGCLEFGAPPARLLVRVPPPLRRVEPRPGRLVLFPSCFYHRTLPFTAPGRRLSLAFDVMPLRGGAP